MNVTEQNPNDLCIPKPRLALNIGITGHRLNKLDPDLLASIASRYRHCADVIDIGLKSIASESQGLFSAQAPLVRIVSALAEGADRIAVTHAPPGWLYEVVLPMPREDYALDFSSDKTIETGIDSRAQFFALLGAAQSVTELPMPLLADEARKRDASYHRLGDFLIRQIDLLVAVWDGEPSAGPGGTADVVAAALASGKPVCWIDVGAGDTVRALAALGDADQSHTTTPLTPSAMLAMLRPVLLPRMMPAPQDRHASARAQTSHHDDSRIDAQPEYLTTRWPQRLYLPFAYMTLRVLAKAGRWAWPLRYPSFAQQLGNWDPFFAAMPADRAVSVRRDVTALLFPRSIWADTLGWYYGNVYRSAYVSSFLLASLSVPLGLTYLFFLWSPAVLNVKAGFVVAELLIITAVVVIVKRGSRSDWHGLWLQTRELSELLRLGRPLAYVGALRDFVPLPVQAEPGSFSSWYARATFREIGLPHTVLDSAYLKSVLAGTKATEIREQRGYHASNAVNLARVHHLLHKSGDLCFSATIVFLLIYLAAWGIDWITIVSHAHAAEAAHGEASHSIFHEILEYGIKPIVSIAAAGLPALGAALTGIREQGDFEGFAERSHATEIDLGVCEARIDALMAKDDVNVDDATEILGETTRVMAKDVTAWKRQYSSKRLALPA